MSFFLTANVTEWVGFLHLSVPHSQVGFGLRCSVFFRVSGIRVSDLVQRFQLCADGAGSRIFQQDGILLLGGRLVRLANRGLIGNNFLVFVPGQNDPAGAKRS